MFISIRRMLQKQASELSSRVSRSRIRVQITRLGNEKKIRVQTKSLSKRFLKRFNVWSSPSCSNIWAEVWLRTAVDLLNVFLCKQSSSPAYGCSYSCYPIDSLAWINRRLLPIKSETETPQRCTNSEWGAFVCMWKVDLNVEAIKELREISIVFPSPCISPKVFKVLCLASLTDHSRESFQQNFPLLTFVYLSVINPKNFLA